METGAGSAAGDPGERGGGRRYADAARRLSHPRRRGAPGQPGVRRRWGRDAGSRAFAGRLEDPGRIAVGMHWRRMGQFEDLATPVRSRAWYGRFANRPDDGRMSALTFCSSHPFRNGTVAAGASCRLLARAGRRCSPTCGATRCARCWWWLRWRWDCSRLA